MILLSNLGDTKHGNKSHLPMIQMVPNTLATWFSPWYVPGGQAGTRE